jgi:FtsP/CotA-like multicopper oxidase with cupredoxin domain
MRTPSWQHTRALLVVALVAAGLAVNGGQASAAPKAIELCAKEGTIALPGAPSVPIWGFGTPTTAGDCNTATAGLPGPVLTADEGDTVTLTVTNALPAGHALSMEIPGINLDAGALEAASGASVTLSFTASNPGTYLYQSGGDEGRQLAMGLYGALVVNSANSGQAYDDAATAFDAQSVLVLSALDPDFNNAPDTTEMHGYHATYWLINGKSYPQPQDTPIQASPGQKLLLRYVNAGYDNTSMALLGAHEHVVARDAHQVPSPFDAVAETIPAGGTEDAIITMPAGGTAPSPDGFPLFNRQLHLTNGDQTGDSPTPATGGGMLVFIHS